MPQPQRRDEPVDTFSIARAADGVYRSDGLRPFLEYRDLGIAAATGGRWRASISHSLEAMPGGTGLHHHTLDVQVVYVLEGWAVFDYAQYGSFRCEPGDCLSQPSGIVHQQSDRSADCRVLELVSPQDFPTFESELTPFVEPDPASGRTDRFSFVQAAKTSFAPHPLLPGLEARDLGIAAATGGRADAQVLRRHAPVSQPAALHADDAAFRMLYVLSGACTVDHGEHGRLELVAGDCVHPPAGGAATLLDCSPDCEILHLASPVAVTQ